MLGEGAPVRGPGEDSSEVEHAHTVERASGAAHRLGRGLPDPLDLDARERTDGSTLRVLGPLVARAHHRAAGPRLCERVLERLRLPLRDTGGDCCGVSALGDAEHAPSRIGEPRERSVEVHPPPVAALVQRDQRIVRHALRRLRVEHPLEHEAQQRRARPSRVDRDRLLDACLVAPDQAGRGRDRAERDCSRRRDGDRARVDRIAPLDRDGVSRARPGARPQRGARRLGHRPSGEGACSVEVAEQVRSPRCGG